MSTPGSASSVIDVTDDDFEKEVIERSRQVPVVVDFWAEWCGPCRILGPILERLAAEARGRFVLAKMNVDRSPRHAQRYGVRGIPTVIAFRNGEIGSEFTGAIPEPAVREFLRKLTPSEADSAYERAEALRAGNGEEAESEYRRALSLEPRHAGAAVGLSEMLLERGEIAEARSLLESVSPIGPLAERAEQALSGLRIRERRPEASESELRSRIAENSHPGPLLLELGKLLASEERYPEALEVLLRAAEASPELARGEVKDLMVEIFHLVGVRSPLADDYRTRLSRLLY